MSYEPTPTGIWSEAIRHIREAQKLMGWMKVESPRGDDVSLAHYYDRQLDTVVGSIDQHYRHKYMEIAIATRPFKVRINLDDGTIEDLP